MKLSITPSLHHFVALSLLLLASCTESRVTHYKPFFSGLEGAEGANAVDPYKGRVEPTTVGGDITGVVENPDGSKIYQSPSPALLFGHIQSLLDEGTPEADKAILDQLIDEHTKEHYRHHDQDPIGYITYLHENRRNIGKTLARMPMAEHSPTVVVDQPGDRTWVLRLTGQAARDVKFTEVWVRQDMGQWKLEWLK